MTEGYTPVLEFFIGNLVLSPIGKIQDVSKIPDSPVYRETLMSGRVASYGCANGARPDALTMFKIRIDRLSREGEKKDDFVATKLDDIALITDDFGNTVANLDRFHGYFGRIKTPSGLSIFDYQHKGLRPAALICEEQNPMLLPAGYHVGLTPMKKHILVPDFFSLGPDLLGKALLCIIEYKKI